MIERIKAAVNSPATYKLTLTIIKLWDLYHLWFIIAFIVLLLATIIFVIRKSPWGKWLLFITILAGASLIALDKLKPYIAEQRKIALRNALLSPVTKTVGKLFRVLWGSST
jgi:hypothetical protein